MRRHFFARQLRVLVIVILPALLGSNLFLSCSKGLIDNWAPHYGITIEEMPEALPVGVALYFPIVVRLESLDGSPIPDSLFCEVRDPEDEHYLDFYLYDDGNAFDHPPGSDLLSLRSGDNVPGDGRFTRQITGQNFTGDYGLYVFAFEMPDGWALGDSMVIRPVELPFFTEITPVVTEFPSGFEPVEYVAHIQKPTAVDRIDSVALAISTTQRPPETLRTIAFVASSADTVWTLTLMPSHFWGIATDLYNFYFTLWDRFGLSADTSHRFITISNGVPTVFNSALPDTIWRPRLGEPNDTAAISVQANDPESLADIAEVRFEVRKVWETVWHDRDPNGVLFYMLDMGGAWDEVAGDGIYSVPLVASPSDSLKDTLYYFRFYGKDKTGQQSEYLTDSVRIIERPAVLAVVGLQTRNDE